MTPRVCQPYRARTKGQVERGVTYVKRNVLAGRRFVSWDALNTWLEEWMATVADQRVHDTTHERPIERFARETLTPLGLRAPIAMSGNGNRSAAYPPTHWWRSGPPATRCRCRMSAGP